MPLAEKTYSKTDKVADLQVKLTPKWKYNPSEDERKTISYVLGRWNDMKWARSRVDNEWRIYQKIIEWKYYRYSDGRTSVNVPIFRALQELFVAEASSRQIQKEIQPIGMSDVEKTEVLREVWDYEWNAENRDEKMTDAEYQCSAYGTCAYMTGFSETTRIISDPSVWDDRTIQYTKKLMREWRIILEPLDIRYVWFDDRVNTFDKCNDEVFVEYITPEQFREEMDNPSLKNTDEVGTVSKADQVFYTWEETGKQNSGLVEKLHYWNKQADRYIILYNRSVVGRDTPIPYAHKELPIVPRQYGKNMYSIYGKWLAEACLQFLDKYNKLSEMIFDAVQRSNTSIFAIWNGLSFDGGKISFNNQVLKFNGTLNDGNFREIRWLPPNNYAIQLLEQLLREIAIFIGIDISQIVGQPNGTAFETAQRVESTLKRINVVLKNRDYALQIVFKLHLSNIMQFFPTSWVEEITETQWNQWYRKILLEDKQYIPETKKIKTDVKGKYELECDPEYIRGQMDIKITTNYNTPTLKSLKQENMNKFLTDFSTYSQVAMQNPELSKVLKPNEFIKQLAFTYDVDISSIGWFSDSISKEWEELQSKVASASGIDMSGWMWWMWWIGWWSQQLLQPQEQNWSSTGMWMMNNLPENMKSLVRTPDMPNMGDLSPAQKVLL